MLYQQSPVLRRGAGLIVAIMLLSTLSACVSFPDEVSAFDPGTRIELGNTPFFPQERFQCGPAALATVLVASGVQVEPETLTSQVYLPSRQGSIRAEMIAATRHHKRLPYELDGSLQSLLDELRAGRPVLILQNLGVAWYPRWHYAVVVGYDPASDEWLLRSGTERVRPTPTKVLLHTWRRSDYWGMVSLRPNELPSSPDAIRLARVITAMEETGHHESARLAWRTLAGAFPEQSVVLFGQANAALSSGDLNQAARLFEAAIAIDPKLMAARNNLAMVQLMLGDQSLALETIREAIRDAGESPIVATLRETESEILAAAERGDEITR